MKFRGLELYGLLVGERAELLNGFDFCGVFGGDSEIFGSIPFEGVGFEVVGIDGPFEFVAEVVDELGEAGDGAELLVDRWCHFGLSLFILDSLCG